MAIIGIAIKVEETLNYGEGAEKASVEPVYCIQKHEWVMVIILGK
jgi:hypothetical protein